MSIIIYFLYGIVLSSVVLMLVCINPIHSVLFFILLFLSSSFMLILLHAEFIGLVFLMVYVGAISVIFLFVVMMLNIKQIERDNATYLVVGAAISLIFFLEILFFFLSPYSLFLNTTDNLFVHNNYLFSMYSDEYYRFDNVIRIGIDIFNIYPILLIVSGLTLLIAMVGSIYLTNTKFGFSNRVHHNTILRDIHVLNLHIH